MKLLPGLFNAQATRHNVNFMAWIHVGHDDPAAIYRCTRNASLTRDYSGRSIEGAMHALRWIAHSSGGSYV